MSLAILVSEVTIETPEDARSHVFVVEGGCHETIYSNSNLVVGDGVSGGCSGFCHGGGGAGSTTGNATGTSYKFSDDDLTIPERRRDASGNPGGYVYHRRGFSQPTDSNPGWQRYGVPEWAKRARATRSGPGVRTRWTCVDHSIRGGSGSRPLAEGRENDFMRRGHREGRIHHDAMNAGVADISEQLTLSLGGEMQWAI